LTAVWVQFVVLSRIKEKWNSKEITSKLIFPDELSHEGLVASNPGTDIGLRPEIRLVEYFGIPKESFNAGGLVLKGGNARTRVSTLVRHDAAGAAEPHLKL
jgi:hypothetical protein